MPATISVHINRLILPLVGVQGIDVMLNGQPATSVTFGQTETIDVPPGAYQVALKLRGVLDRTSNTIPIELSEGQQASLIGKYDRFWGSFSLTLA